MLEALWTVEFGSNLGNFGAGVAIFETGRILGGDSSFTYEGSYCVNDGSISAEIEVKKHSETLNMQSVFGPLSQFHLKLVGPANPNRICLRGIVVENPSLQIVINGVRRAELPNP